MEVRIAWLNNCLSIVNTYVKIYCAQYRDLLLSWFIWEKKSSAAKSSFRRLLDLQQQKDVLWLLNTLNDDLHNMFTSLLIHSRSGLFLIDFFGGYILGGKEWVQGHLRAIPLNVVGRLGQIIEFLQAAVSRSMSWTWSFWHPTGSRACCTNQTSCVVIIMTYS